MTHSESLPVLLGVAFYNSGLHTQSVSTKKLYSKWIVGNLRRDVSRMIEEYNMEVICLCEIIGVQQMSSNVNLGVHKMFLCKKGAQQGV